MSRRTEPFAPIRILSYSYIYIHNIIYTIIHTYTIYIYLSVCILYCTQRRYFVQSGNAIPVYNVPFLV